VIVVLQGCVIVALKGCIIVALQGCMIVVLQEEDSWAAKHLPGGRKSWPAKDLRAAKDLCGQGWGKSLKSYLYS
jgi:rhodanese-related sulfurtransferase